MPGKSFSLSIKKKIQSFSSTIKPDSDKSISIRSFILGCVSEDITRAKNVLESEDVTATIKCLRKLNYKIIKVAKGDYKIFGKGTGSAFCKKGTQLNFQNSGTAARLIMGVLSTNSGIKVKLNGDQSLKKRSMKKLISLLNKFGASFYPVGKNTLPLTLISSEMPIGINYVSGISAQLKSACILAALNSYGVTNIYENFKSRNHTENMLKKNIGVIKITKDKNIKIFGKQNLNNFKIDVPNDPSSAAFFTALTLLTEKSSLNIRSVGLNPRRIGFYKILKRSGAKIFFRNKKRINGEIVGDLLIKSSKLKPLNSTVSEFSTMVDEFPILFVIASFIPGVSTFRGIDDLKNKESDRIGEMKKIIKTLKISFSYSGGIVKILGSDKKDYSNKNIKVPDLKDHRICMSTAILSLVSGAKTHIDNFETVNTSSPSFLKLIKKLGGKFEKK
ncbi:MAG: 3-phosphoshikimate 1-carboxyvinyltransferase [Candidatus Pelagibacter sp.]|nr:3-phosphoshikimate 1-carboxyvinyltransferase [Candidatus Pelagibacter sp.]OUW24744.1 MAG: 3-phosphoshikimate 1-carboxyvinyltransferase [Rickettsiales bacterium TMED174]|tara:strand:- start:180 stop:1517 length:1338 start_codon:yes stop_codon:yes gene_type:complete